ncbi:hypothetical protein AVEN_221540-1 [Araneus ventricosus]|uniref:Uncharacterized protein n=1 Tax=Araneus ventricosus TaxID=182803 RepID=A0A4Y2TNK4_ARAVE|nr:hypothetical protein AVEN_221540-1 [Araneus ventricosus]
MRANEKRPHSLLCRIRKYAAQYASAPPVRAAPPCGVNCDEKARAERRGSEHVPETTSLKFSLLDRCPNGRVHNFGLWSNDGVNIPTLQTSTSY